MIPDNVEKIIMTKEDYDRNVEQMLVNKLELEDRIIKALDFIERYLKLDLEEFNANSLLNKLKKILKGEENENNK